MLFAVTFRKIANFIGSYFALGLGMILSVPLVSALFDLTIPRNMIDVPNMFYLYSAVPLFVVAVCAIVIYRLNRAVFPDSRNIMRFGWRNFVLLLLYGFVIVLGVRSLTLFLGWISFASMG